MKLKNAFKEYRPLCLGSAKHRAALLAPFFALLLLALCLTASCSGRHNTAVIVAGSTSVQPYAEILAEEFSLLCPDCEVDVQGGGSSAGITAAESGAADIGLSSRVLKENEQHLWFVEIAKDGLAIIIHPANPLSNLTIEQVRAIYAADISNWSELGGANNKIHLITREEGSGTRSAFEDLVMEEKRITTKAIVQDSNGAVKQLVSSDKNSIGFISLGLVDETVMAISLNGLAANWDNIANGSYPLFRPFLFICKEPPTGQTKQFIDFTLSDQGQQILIKEGLIPQQTELKDE
ncbi:MAG: phosphate ABC transporter substrate-binding protein [Firmicutes bacterium]|nr:phosphate ABC transporter substrate-binding protein [Bacillota bacterium]